MIKTILTHLWISIQEGPSPTTILLNNGYVLQNPSVPDHLCWETAPCSEYCDSEKVDEKPVAKMKS